MAKMKAKKTQTHAWRTSVKGRALFALVYAVLAYVFGSLALDSGSMWLYALTLLSLGLAVRDAVGVLKAFNDGNK